MEAKKPENQLSVGENGFVYVQGVKVARFVPERGGMLQFLDKNSQRSAARGTRVVEVSVAEIGKLLDPKS